MTQVPTREASRGGADVRPRGAGSIGRTAEPRGGIAEPRTAHAPDDHGRDGVRRIALGDQSARARPRGSGDGHAQHGRGSRKRREARPLGIHVLLLPIGELARAPDAFEGRRRRDPPGGGPARGECPRRVLPRRQRARHRGAARGQPRRRRQAVRLREHDRRLRRPGGSDRRVDAHAPGQHLRRHEARGRAARSWRGAPTCTWWWSASRRSTGPGTAAC